MLKKMIIIGIILIFLIPSQSVDGSNLQIDTRNENKIIFQGFEADVINMIDEVNYTTLFGYLERIVSFGIRPVGSDNCSRGADYIKNEFLRLGLDSYIDEWKYPKYRCRNVIGIHNGSDTTSDAVFVLTAHLDTKGESVGANDDGSGIAAILAIANITSKYQFNHTIKFVIVSGEEVGTYGSYDYGKKAYKKDENIIANINLDSIGNYTCGNVLQARFPSRSCHLYHHIEDISKKYENLIDMKVQETANTRIDSQAFVDYGYDAISFVQPKFFEYPYHTPDDTLDKIRHSYFENATKLILAFTAELAYKEIVLQVRFTAPKEGCVYFYNRPVLKLPGFNIFRTNLRAMTYLIGRSIAKINITTKEEIINVFYSIDGNTDFDAIFNGPPFDWKIKKPSVNRFRIRGRHKLGVHVCTASGNTAYDEMDFYAPTRI